MLETNNFSDSVIFKENGQLKAQCSDCNKVLSLMNGRQYHIEVGDNDTVVGVTCPACAERLRRAKRSKNT